ncbi:hypothetical protein BS78_05G247300 [Paspalum vaginatum]|nr:hypothetical protein BS78_05G247300 [Paspalum vaginatum]
MEWVFHPDLGTPGELAEVDEARRVFAEHRFERRHSSDLIMRMQWSGEKNTKMDVNQLPLSPRKVRTF